MLCLQCTCAVSFSVRKAGEDQMSSVGLCVRIIACADVGETVLV